MLYRLFTFLIYCSKAIVIDGAFDAPIFNSNPALSTALAVVGPKAAMRMFCSNSGKFWYNS